MRLLLVSYIMAFTHLDVLNFHQNHFQKQINLAIKIYTGIVMNFCLICYIYGVQNPQDEEICAVRQASNVGFVGDLLP